MSSTSTSVQSVQWPSSPLGELPRPARWIPRIPPAAIASVAFVIAGIAGRFFADGRITLGAALVFGVCYAPLAFLNLTLAFAAYVAILFVQDTAALSVGPNTMGLLVFLGWLGTIVTRSARAEVLREQSRLLLALTLFALWLILSMIWSVNSTDTASILRFWLIALAAFLVTVTALRTARDVTTIAIAFIVGAVASVIYGIASGALSASATAANEIALQGRFTGGGGDPNVQAAGLMVGMFLCAGLWSLATKRPQRLTLLLAFIAITIGFFATQSRGALLALAAAAVAGLILLPRQRKRLLGLAGAAGVGLLITAVVNPGALSRMSNFGGGTSGRSDIWTVAWHIFTGHPWVGVGLNNFQLVEPQYTLKVGVLARVELIAESPHLVHNVYLQLLTETGIVGLIIFLVIIGGCLRASWLASRRFDVSGQVGYGDLARAVLMASIAMLAAQFFISDGDDLRLWILLGLGPVLLSLARRQPPSGAPRLSAKPFGESRPRRPPEGIRQPAH